MHERTSPICTKIKTYRRSSDALGKKIKKKKMENSRVCRPGTEHVKLSGVPEKAYNSRPSEFGGFWLCACIPT